MERRDLFKGVLTVGGVAMAQAGQALAAPGDPAGPLPPLPKLTDPGERRGDMLYRTLGRIKEKVSAIGFGGSHFAKPTDTVGEVGHQAASAAKREVRVGASGRPANQAAMRSRLRAAAVATCCRPTLGRPR